MTSRQQHAVHRGHQTKKMPALDRRRRRSRAWCNSQRRSKRDRCPRAEPQHPRRSMTRRHLGKVRDHQTITVAIAARSIETIDMPSPVHQRCEPPLSPPPSPRRGSQCCKHWRQRPRDIDAACGCLQRWDPFCRASNVGGRIRLRSISPRPSR